MSYLDLKTSKKLAVPIWSSTLDENSVRTIFRTRSKSYIPIETDKFAFFFYFIVDWQITYVFSILTMVQKIGVEILT